GFSKRTINGVAYWLGSETGITHTFTDTTAKNGQQYYYAVTAYDFGYEPGGDSAGFYPSENAIAVQRTTRGGLILPKNVVAVRANPRVPGFGAAHADTGVHVAGTGTGHVGVKVVNSDIVPDKHLFAMHFATPSPDSVRASTYSLKDSTTNELLFKRGSDISAEGIGPVGSGLLPLVSMPLQTEPDTTRSGWDQGSTTDAAVRVSYLQILDPNYRRAGYPNDMTITFSDTYVDSGVFIPPVAAAAAKFFVTAHTDTGDVRMKFRFRDTDKDGTLSTLNDQIDILCPAPVRADSQTTWR